MPISWISFAKADYQIGPSKPKYFSNCSMALIPSPVVCGLGISLYNLGNLFTELLKNFILLKKVVPTPFFQSLDYKNCVPIHSYNFGIKYMNQPGIHPPDKGINNFENKNHLSNFEKSQFYAIWWSFRAAKR